MGTGDEMYDLSNCYIILAVGEVIDLRSLKGKRLGNDLCGMAGGIGSDYRLGRFLTKSDIGAAL